MTWPEALVVFTILWWVVFFCVLPFGITRAGEEHLGHDAGAPKDPMVGKKALITTGIAAVLFAIAYAIIVSPYLSFRGR